MNARPASRRRSRKLVFYAFMYVVLLAMAVAFLFPLLWVVGLSLKTQIQAFTIPPPWIWKPTFANYISVLRNGDFLQAFGNSLGISTAAVLLSICVGMPAAYSMARFPYRGRSLLFISLLLMRMLPPIAVLVPMYVLFSKLGLTTTRLSVVLAYAKIGRAHV